MLRIQHLRLALLASTSPTSSKILKKVSYHVWTAFLFTKSDIKTMLIPILAHAAASAPFASWDRVLPTAFWIWIQVLMNALANQILNPAEDALNKPSRPIPSGRVSMHTATILRWLIPLANLAWSATYSKEVFLASLACVIVATAYNEGGLAATHWASRNGCIGLGMAMIEVGACLVAGNTYRSLDTICLVSILCSGLISATTYHAGDFKDVEGDRLVNRSTIPLVHPKSSRPILAFLLVAWSVALSSIWRLPDSYGFLITFLALHVGRRFVTGTETRDDQRSCVWYYVWMSIAHALPTYTRFVASAGPNM